MTSIATTSEKNNGRGERLTGAERNGLILNEEVIERGLASFVEVGQALAHIRDRRLYRAEYDTFEDYCAQRWSMSRPRAYQFIESAAVTSNLSKILDNPPTVESHAAELSAVPESEQAAVWQEAVDTAPKGKVTAAHVKETVKRRTVPKCSNCGHDEFDEDGDCAKCYEPKQTAAQRPAKDNYRTRGTGEVEWYTPPEIIALAKEVMGDIDIDPASCELAQQTVFAYRYIDKAENGLTQEWHGRVWLNPPYCQPDIQQFVEKLLGEIQAGRTSTVLLLTNNATDTAWWQSAAKRCDAICLTAGRIKFHTPSGVAGHPLQGQSLFYFGRDAETFGRVFSSVGLIVSPLAVACLQEAAS